MYFAFSLASNFALAMMMGNGESLVLWCSVLLLLFAIQLVYRVNAFAAVPTNCRKSATSQLLLASTTSPPTIDSIQSNFAPHLFKNYWGRKPLLIRQAFDTSELLEEGIWPAWDDIIELACHEDADEELNTGESARIITHIPNQLDSFELELGPFKELYIDELKNDNNRRWTLLVNDVDRYMPALSDWMDRDFGFLPRWRRDDAQVSIATKGGGIGPHVDNYDVFLIQSSGSRSWLIGHDDDKLNAAQERQALVPNISVRILQGDYEYTKLELQAGDVLYLPPRTVHWGTALTDDCMTLSVGCRAPSAAELVARIAENMAYSVSEKVVRRYTDENLLNKPWTSGPSLTDEVKDSMKELVSDAAQEVLDDSLVWDEIVGKLATEPKRLPYSALHPYDEIDDDEYLETWGETLEDLLDRILNGQGALYRAEGISFATSQIKSSDGSLIDRLFACGEMFEVHDDPMAATIFERIEQGHALNSKNLVGITTKIKDVLETLVAEGLLDASDDVEEER